MSVVKGSLGTVLIGLAASAMTAVSLGAGTMAGFVSTIANTHNGAGTGYIVMQEQDSSGGVSCTSNGAGSNNNSASCSTINKYGGDLGMVAGSSVTTSVTIKNTGSVAASTLALSVGPCSSSKQPGVAIAGTGNLCDKVTVTIAHGSTTVFTGTAGELAGRTNNSLGPVAVGGAPVFTITVKVDDSIGSDYAGLQITQPLTWTFTA